MGSSYVNDFDFNNRSYRVYVQADAAVPPHRQRPAPVLRPLRLRPDDPARQSRHHHRDLRPAGHQPLQPLPLRRDRRLTGARPQLRPGPRRHGELVQQEQDARHELRVDRPRARRDRVRRQGHHHLRPRPARRLSHPLGRSTRASRCPSSSCSPSPWPSSARSASSPARPRQRRLLPDRPRHAHRPLGQKLDPDRRVCRAAARARAAPSPTPPSRPPNCACAPSS